MLIISLRTDKPEAEIGLFDDNQQLAYHTWQAHRVLAETLHSQLRQLVNDAGKTLSELDGIVVFKGPGSFTGLRIGVSVANTLSYSLRIPIIARSDPDWLQTAITDIVNGGSEAIALPEYGAAPHITPQKK